MTLISSRVRHVRGASKLMGDHYLNTVASCFPAVAPVSEDVNEDQLVAYEETILPKTSGGGIDKNHLVPMVE